MIARADFAGRITDAGAGPIGSKAWVESRAKRLDGGNLPLSPSEMTAFRERIMEQVSASAYSHPARPFARFQETTIGDSGKLEPIADFDDSPGFTPLDKLKKIAFRHEAEKCYEQECDDETGVLVDLERKAKKDEEKAILRAQSHAIARKLELAKVHGYRSGEWHLWSYGVHSGEWDMIPQFRRIAFIPFVAAMLRGPHVRALESYLQRHLWCRFWTLTGGERVPLHDIKSPPTKEFPLVYCPVNKYS